MVNWIIHKTALRLYLALFITLLIAGCGGAATPPSDPTSAPPTEAPAAVPTEAPTAAPTEEPVATSTAEPTMAPLATVTSALAPSTVEDVRFTWAPGGVPPSDSDDVDAIVLELRDHAGILGGRGNEIAITVEYDPTIITVEEIQEILRSMGHPVEVAD